jgi:Ser/Thr protein kinase RdoA (MazF antagonist)
MADELLQGGRMTPGVMRRGSTVRRRMGPWSPAVHAYLQHLEEAGFSGAPRLVEVDGDVEVLSYLPGEVAADPNWESGKGNPLTPRMRSAESLQAVAALLRELHEASAGFTPPTATFQFHHHPLRPGEIMSHGDLGPWNTVYREGRPAAFIDWDACQPVDPLLDVATAAWAFIPLAPDKALQETGFDPLPDLGERLRVFTDAYGELDRSSLLPALVKAKLTQANRIGHWQLGPKDSAVSLEYYARELRWLDEHLAQLERALS